MEVVLAINRCAELWSDILAEKWFSGNNKRGPTLLIILKVKSWLFGW